MGGWVVGMVQNKATFSNRNECGKSKGKQWPVRLAPACTGDACKQAGPMIIPFLLSVQGVQKVKPVNCGFVEYEFHE